MDQQIWQWTLTKEAIAPCFVRDVLAMRQHANGGDDFFWLGHTPCRSVILVGMVVGIQVYDKRTIYAIDDGTAVIDCILRHPRPAIPDPKPRSPQGSPDAKSNTRRPSPKKPRLDKTKLEPTEPPPPITEPGYPVRVVGRVVRHYQSKQIHADTIDPCPSSLDEIAHLERVIHLHKTKYSLGIPFVPPSKRPGITPIATSTKADASVFADASPAGPDTASYTLPPPPMPMPLQSRNRPSSVPTHHHEAYHMHAPSSPTASSVASSTPSSPCKPSSPIKLQSHEASRKTKMRHPSRLHTRDLTGNTFRLYVKHYMDNAPSPFLISLPSPSRSTCGGLATPMKHSRGEYEDDEPTPRPRIETDEDESTMGFTLSHLRRVPELALLAARIVRTETRKREKAEREKERGTTRSRIPSSSSASTLCKEGKGASAEPPRKKIKRLFSWAIVKLYEEGSIVLWDGDVRPLPVPPPPVLEGDGGLAGERIGSGLWKNNTQSTFGDPSVSCSRSYGDPFSSTSISLSTSVLYTSSASASLYSHYHPPRPSTKRSRNERGQADADPDVEVDPDADPGCVSDPGADEEAYIPLTPRLLAGHVKEALGALRRGRRGAGAGGRGAEPTPEDIVKYLQRTDGRWERVGVWAVEEALAVLRGG